MWHWICQLGVIILYKGDVGLWSMHLAFMVSSVRRPQADQPGITPWMTWLPEPWSLPASRSQKNLKFSAVQTVSGSTVFLSPPGRQGSHSFGTLPCGRFVRCQSRTRSRLSSRAAADRKSAKYTDLDTRYSFQPVAIETLGPINDSACEFLFNLVARFLFSQAMIERAAFSFSESLSWSSDLMLFCYMSTNGHSSCLHSWA